jgi:hypothetical protein
MFARLGFEEDGARYYKTDEHYEQKPKPWIGTSFVVFACHIFVLCKDA